jgi:hypothetical protein
MTQQEDGELADAQREATQFVREYFEDPRASVRFVARSSQSPDRGFLFEVVAPVVTERKHVHVRRYLGVRWLVEFADH